jgi:hypothetical protein
VGWGEAVEIEACHGKKFVTDCSGILAETLIIPAVIDLHFSFARAVELPEAVPRPPGKPPRRYCVVWST